MIKNSRCFHGDLKPRGIHFASIEITNVSSYLTLINGQADVKSLKNKTAGNN